MNSTKYYLSRYRIQLCLKKEKII
ncbi:MAG: hypothetical protein METHSR3v1_1910012 [Methanothrix sp.]|nr:MAG: hypothetical protein METHSR3v1_1910012 [Methanothrix sp.]